MPSNSRAQQRLMGAAEHGAQFPMAQKLRNTMTLQQLHDFASGPMAGKPVHVAAVPPLPQAMVQHQQLVKDAHAHLAQVIPNFNKLPGRQRMVAVQEHVRTRKANGY